MIYTSTTDNAVKLIIWKSIAVFVQALFIILT